MVKATNPYQEILLLDRKRKELKARSIAKPLRLATKSFS